MFKEIISICIEIYFNVRKLVTIQDHFCYEQIMLSQVKYCVIYLGSHEVK